MRSLNLILSLMISFFASIALLTDNAQAQEADTEEPETKAETEVEPKPSGKDAIPAEPKPEAPLVRSATSLALENRLSLGTSVGWAYVKPSAGTWTGIGGSTLHGSWRNSAKPDGILFITGRYAPFTGVWRLNDRDYNTTAHGLFAGTSWLLPFSKKAEIKAGVEVGYLMVYAIPQDRAEVDGKVKGGKAAAGITSEVNWTVLSKMKIGPTIRVGGGGFTYASLGAAANYVF